MIELIVYVSESLLTAVSTIIIGLVVYISLLYLYSSLMLFVWSVYTGIFKNPFMWFNPAKLIKYKDKKTTITTENGSYIINYEGLLPKTNFVKTNR